MKTKLHFARFEFKYILPQQLREDVESELQYFLELDPYVQSRADHKYFVRSLYYEDPHFTSFHDKQDGIHTRSKFRVRTYTNELDEETPCFLELKGRYNNLVFKHRVLINCSIEDKKLSRSAFTDVVVAKAEDAPVRDQFLYSIYRKRIRPIALVDYRRRPYVSKYDAEFRLTFDEYLHATESASLFPSKGETARHMLPGYTVMEVKFRYQIPSWFHRIIQAFELRRVSISKICEAVETLGLAENLS